MALDTNRRVFLGAAAFSIVPRHVLGGAGFVAPSDRMTLGYIGTGTEGLREMLPLLSIPEIRITSVCDPSRDAVGYRDWGRDGLTKAIRRVLNKPEWRAGADDPIPGGRLAAKNIVDTAYGETGQGCTAYADFREMLAKERDLTAVKIMTPDHLHGVISMAAMRRGKHVMMHKPLANRLLEARRVVETARQTGVATHFEPWEPNGDMTPVMKWIREGAIGTLKEVHNWSNRPVWPQYPTMPMGTPAVPEGFDWDLWLGPEAERPYHSDYTHMVFRGWYDFGGGSMADMGHYSLWTVFNALELDAPTSVEPMLSHFCELRDGVSRTIRNDFSFPIASAVRFRFPARGERGAVCLVWYDGGIRPFHPEELEVDGRELPPEGMMFVGDKGKILAGFRVEDPRLIPERRMAGYPPPVDPNAQRHQPAVPGTVSPSMRAFLNAARGGPRNPASFLNAGPISDAVNLYAIALRTGQRLRWDGAKVTNVAEANRYLDRQYRKGWEPQSL
jgi:hypothetical protein